MKKGAIHTDAAKEKNRLAHLGRKRSADAIRKFREKMCGRHLTEETKRKISLAHKGKKKSKEHLKNISEAKKGKPSGRKGIKATEETKKRISEGHKGLMVGTRNHQWRGGVSTMNNLIRGSANYKIWRKGCLIRDHCTCQKCWTNGGWLQVHHINNFSEFEELRFAINNGITLCSICHKLFHNVYGRKNNTKEQLEKFLAFNI